MWKVTTFGSLVVWWLTHKLSHKPLFINQRSFGVAQYHDDSSSKWVKMITVISSEPCPLPRWHQSQVMNRGRVTWGCTFFFNESRWKSRSEFHRLWTRVTWRERVVCRVSVLEHLEKFYCDNLYNLDGKNFDKFYICGVGIDDYPSIVAWGWTRCAFVP